MEEKEGFRRSWLVGRQRRSEGARVSVVSISSSSVSTVTTLTADDGERQVAKTGEKATVVKKGEAREKSENLDTCADERRDVLK